MLELDLNFTEEPNGAIFSNTRHRRYLLWRSWDLSLDWVLLIGINPSTAGELKNDPTISRLTKIFKSWDYGGFIICNLSSKVSSNPRDIREPGSVFPLDDEYMMFAKDLCQEIVFMWGNEGERFIPRINHLQAMFPNAHCFGQNKNGHPRHPLYVPEKDLNLVSFNWSLI